MKSDKMPDYKIKIRLFTPPGKFNLKNRCMCNNPENYLTAKIGEHIPCGYSMSTIWAFYSIEGKHILYRRKEFMKNVSISLREHEKI